MAFMARANNKAYGVVALAQALGTELTFEESIAFPYIIIETYYEAPHTEALGPGTGSLFTKPSTATISLRLIGGLNKEFPREAFEVSEREARELFKEFKEIMVGGISALPLHINSKYFEEFVKEELKNKY
jgi:hypothetical protein